MGGCWGSGLSIYDKRFFKFSTYRHDEKNSNSPSGKSVTSFAEDENGTIWLSTDGGGIDCFDPKEKKFYRQNFLANDPNRPTSNKVLSLVADQKGGLWAGMWNGGLNYFRIKGKRLFLEKRFDRLNPEKTNNTSVFRLYIDPEDRLWVGTFQDEVYFYDDRSRSFVSLGSQLGAGNDTISQLTVNDIQYDPEGFYWISTQDFGLLKANLQQRTYQFYPPDLENPLGQPAQLISFTFRDSQNRFWVGTNLGLCLFNPLTEIFKTYTVDDGLADNNITGMMEDGPGNLWISSSMGLSRIIPANSGDFPLLSIRNFVLTDGLQGNLFNRWAYLKSRNNAMYFGGINGFNVFHPDSLSENRVVPPVVLTNFLLFNKPVTAGQKDSPLKKQLAQTDELVLKHHQNYFTLQFVALNYIMSNKNEYAYIMEGLDKEWNYVGTRTEATYTHLQPGQYIFRVKASNNDGYWNEEGASVKIIILPPWWKTKIFRGLMILLALAGLAYLIYRSVQYYRRLAHQTILNERNQIQTLIDNIPDQVFIKDLQSRFVVVNRETARQLGSDDPQWVIQKSDYDFFSKEVADPFFRQEQSIMETRIPLINAELKTEKNGNEYYSSVTKCPIINPRGETIGLVGIIRDITDQKRAELHITRQSLELHQMNQALSETNQLLENRQNLIEEQAEELMQQKEELMNSNQQLNQVIATKDKLFSIIAHDVKNPFSIIVGFSELLLFNMTHWDEEEKINAAQIIYESSRDLFGLLDNMLQWARDQRGLVKCYPRKTFVEPFVKNLMSSFKYSLLQKNIKTTTRFSNKELSVWADPQLLDTVLRNLIGNAIKFTHVGGRIDIGAKTESDRIIIHVSDNGIGIPDEKIPFLFTLEKHRSSDGTNKESGTGLGLILVKEFVEKMGGSIWVESTLEKGSVFSISLPVSREQTS